MPTYGETAFRKFGVKKIENFDVLLADHGIEAFVDADALNDIQADVCGGYLVSLWYIFCMLICASFAA